MWSVWAFFRWSDAQLAVDYLGEPLRDYGLGPTGACALGQRSQNMYDE